MKYFPIILVSTLLFSACHPTQQAGSGDLAVAFDGQARIEVGGPYVGAAFHRSYPVPQRISFFNPLANSMDQSSDYWTRDSSVIFTAGLQIGDGERQDLSRVPTEFDLTPYNVSFTQNVEAAAVDFKYQFCQDNPALVATITVKNTGTSSATYHLDTRLATSLRTCHTFRRIETGWTRYDSANAALITRYPDAEVDDIIVFAINAGATPVAFDSRAKASALESVTIPPSQPEQTAASFLYSAELAPGEELQVVQVIGSCKAAEVDLLVADLRRNYRSDVEKYEAAIRAKAYDEYRFHSGDPVLDHSVHWAKAVLAALNHHLDGEIVPMPCPAEYNFYFTHDALVTDLAAGNFDPARVRRDLTYLIEHADENYNIPHAYYWKDDGFKTEYADSNNWNHFWYIQVAAGYLRHSADRDLLRRCYPYLTRSLEYAMHSREDDGLLYAYYLDGWDIGHNFGPRAFMTIMALKGIRDYIYISTVLGENTGRLAEYEQLATEMEQALADHLWSEEESYLLNFYEDGSVDPHYYAGALLAAHFHLLDREKRQQLIATAGEKLVDPLIGVYTVAPADFHLLGDYLRFKGNEVGPPYVYANGAVWNHCNAWYSLGLMATGRRGVAYDFIRRVMTIDGITHSPNGQPAMYEYRNSNFNDQQVYGQIDKPQFMWAAGWYLYTLYHLYGVEENSWNVALQPYLPEGQGDCDFDLALAGRKVRVRVSGTGQFLQSISCDGQPAASSVCSPQKQLDLVLGRPTQPYLAQAEAVVEACQYDYRQRELTATLKAFSGHKGTVEVVSPLPVSAVLIDGLKPESSPTTTRIDGIDLIEIPVIHSQDLAELKLVFGERKDN